MNEGMWIKVTVYETGRNTAINLRHVVRVGENSRDDAYQGKRSTIYFSNGDSIEVYESFDEIGAMIL